MDDSTLALAVWDDGSGEALYAGGAFTTAGGTPANWIAKWDGSTWSALGSGVDGSFGVRALAVWDDGSGEALYAGGQISTAGGTPANRIAKWDGSTWSALGSGMDGFGVLALTVYDDGGGEALYAGGEFTTAGGTPASNIAKWDGSTWSALGSGTNSAIRDLTVYDDGSGEALYAGGAFLTAGGMSSAHFAEWACGANSQIFSDGFESGDTSAWSATVD
jgi:hypothetical protein